jgi:uncharacterized protein YigA (DUF484 family)
MNANAQKQTTAANGYVPCQAVEDTDENGQAFVRTVGGQFTPVACTACATVRELRDSTAKALGLRASELRLIANGKELAEDGATLQSLGVSAATRIHALLRLRGAGSAMKGRDASANSTARAA